MYTLNLADDNRILSAGVVIEGRNYDGQIIVDKLPDDTDGKWVSDYCYIDGEYIYDPLSRLEESKPEPTAEEIMNALLGVGV